MFAGYVEPGKHQIIIKDQQTGKYYAREIVVDGRSRDIVNCRKYSLRLFEGASLSLKCLCFLLFVDQI